MPWQAVNLDAVPTEPTEADRELLYRYIEAFERYDVDSLVALLHEDATLSMPPYELWLQGIPDIRRFLAALEVEGGRDRVIEVAANGCPALAVYRPAGPSGALEPFEIHVLEIADGRMLRSTPSSTRLYSRSSDSLRLPNRSANRRFPRSGTRPSSLAPAVTNDSCTILPSPQPCRRERLATRIPSRDSPSPFREARPVQEPHRSEAADTCEPEISGGATTFLSRRSCTRWGAAKDASPKNRPRRQHRCLYS